MTSEPEQVVISPDSFDVAIFDLDGVITDTARSMPPPGNTSSTSTHLWACKMSVDMMGLEE